MVLKSKAKIFILSLLMMLSIISCKQTPVVRTEPIEFSKDIKSLFNEIFQRSAFPCMSFDETARLNSVWQDGNDLLLIMQVPDYLCFPHSVVIVRVNEQKEWQIVEVFEGDVYGVAAIEQSLMIVSGWAIEGTFPYVLYSDDGNIWNNLALPKDRKRDCCFDQIERVWQTDEELWIDFYAEGDTPASRWALSLGDFKSGEHDNWSQRNIPNSDSAKSLNYDDPVFQNTVGSRWRKIPIEQQDNVVSISWKGMENHRWQFQLPTLSPLCPC